MTTATTIGALCIVSLTGCTLSTPVVIDTKQYALSTVPGDLPTERTHAATLLVLVPETASAYATPRMAYTTQKYQIAYFSQNECSGSTRPACRSSATAGWGRMRTSSLLTRRRINPGLR